MIQILLILLLINQYIYGQSIIAVDPGSNFMKTVLVQPGKVFDIALSPDSKRKTFTGVAIVDGVRSFGSESFNVYGKKPQNTVWKVRDLLGRTPNDHELLRTLQRHFLVQHRLLEAEDGTGAIRIEFAKGTKDARIFSPEELFAMILTHCKENGERHGTTKVSALTMTVPMFYSQARRQGLVDAAEIAGLSLLGLIDENGAAAIQFALDRSFNETATNILFFNMGAASTQVSIVQITGGKDKRTSKEFRNIKVLAKAWDESLGVEDLDLALALLFAKEFDEKHPSPDNKISDAPRALVRLKKEGRQVKEILSGLEKFPVSFQSLHRDVDFKSQVTRAQLEDLTKDILDRVRAPVERVLNYANMNVKDLNLVEVIGGGFRVPGVRDSLRKVIPAELDFSTHVNGDEGMAFGAAYFAANLSSTFHVPRVVLFQDCVPREVRLLLKGQDLDRDVPLFNRFAPMEGKEPTKQIIKFRHDKDFRVSLIEKKALDDDPVDAASSTIAEQYEITGFSGAMIAFGKFGEPKVHLTFTMDRSMMLNLVQAEAKFEEEYDEIVKPANSTGSKNATENSTATGDESATTTPQVVKKTRKHIYSLTIKRTDEEVLVKKMTNESKLKAIMSLRQMDEEDKARARKEEARNGLESFSFVSREKLSTHENEVKLVTDEESLEQLRLDLAGVEDWIDDHKQASENEFIEQKNKLTSRVDKIFHLIREYQERPAAIQAFTSLIDTLITRRANWTVERPWIQDNVWVVVDKVQDDAKKWIIGMQAKQAELLPKQDPILSLSSIRLEMEKIQKVVELLLKQRKPAPIKVPDEKSTSSNNKRSKESNNNTNKDEKTTVDDDTTTLNDDDDNNNNTTSSNENEKQEQDDSNEKQEL